MKIHAIQTGTVAIKTRQVEGAGEGSRRRLNMFLDREWTDPLPIYAFAIEHPEGVIVDATARLTHERIRAFASETPTVYLVAHDLETAARLAERRVVPTGVVEPVPA